LGVSALSSGPGIPLRHASHANEMSRWSALSMAAYGGHLAIARALLDQGADMDNVDVDGDTPLQLAVTRGHSEMAILFDQVRAERDLQAREQDTEQPRR
jgi:ankyrin repeat protein